MTFLSLHNASVVPELNRVAAKPNTTERVTEFESCGSQTLG